MTADRAASTAPKSVKGTGVVVVGSAHMDLIATGRRLPVRGETMPAHAFTIRPGGKATNQATQAARAGAPTSLIAKVGDDDFGNQLRQSLVEGGVDVSHVGISPDHATGVSPMLVGEGGDYASMIYPGAATHLTSADLDAAELAFSGAAVVVLQLEIPSEISTAAAQIAQRIGATVILNAAPSPDDISAVPKALFEATDILVVNTVEAEMLAGRSISDTATAEEVAQSLRLHLPPHGSVIVTLGEDGAVLANPHGVQRISGHAVNVVQTIGGGDSLIGMLAAEIARGSTVSAALSMANAAAALTVSRRRSTDPLPSREDVIRFLTKQAHFSSRADLRH